MRVKRRTCFYVLLLGGLTSLIAQNDCCSLEARPDTVEARYQQLAAPTNAGARCSDDKGYKTAREKLICRVRTKRLASLRLQQFAQQHTAHHLADDALFRAVEMETDALLAEWYWDASKSHVNPDVDAARRPLEDLISRYPDSEHCASAIQEFVNAFAEMDLGDGHVGKVSARLMKEYADVGNSWSFSMLIWPHYLKTLQFDKLVMLAEGMGHEYAARAPFPPEEVQAISQKDLERTRKWRAEYLLTCVGEVLGEYRRLNFGYPSGRYYSWGLLYDLIQPYGKRVEGGLDEVDPFSREFFLEFVEYESDGAGYTLKARITLESEVDKIREIGPETKAESWSRYAVWKINIVDE